MKRLTMALALVALGGCAGMGASKGEQAVVADADLGRLKADQMDPVNDAREFQASAKDEKARAELRLQQAQHEIELAKADQAKAAADEEKAKAERKIADDSREPSAVQRAQDLETQARLSKEAADLHLEYAKRLEEARKADLDAAQRRMDLGDAKLELAKVQALRDGDVAAAAKYDVSRFQARVNEAQTQQLEAERRANEHEQQATALQQRWEDAQRQLQARTEGGNAG